MYGDHTEAIVASIIAFILTLLVTLGLFLVVNTTNGQHTGYVTAVDQEGLFFKNYRVYFKTDVSSSQEDEYCINRSNTELANKVKAAAKNKQTVTIDYRGNVGFGLAQCEKSEIRDIN